MLKVARDSMVAPFGSRGAATDSLADHLTDLVTNEVQARYFSATGHDSRWDTIRGGISALRARIRKLDEPSSTSSTAANGGGGGRNWDSNSAAARPSSGIANADSGNRGAASTGGEPSSTSSAAANSGGGGGNVDSNSAEATPSIGIADVNGGNRGAAPTSTGGADAPPARKKTRLSRLMRKFVNHALRGQLKRALGGRASRTSVRHTKEDFAQCAWMRLYTSPETRKPGTTLNARWVKRFRLPIDMFDEVLDRLRGAGISDSAKTFGSYTAPLEMKLMATLRWLGRGEAFDTIAELTGDLMGESTVARVCKAVVAALAGLKGDFVRAPTTQAELDVLLALYGDVSIPGCVACADGVQFLWPMAPFGQSHLYLGKGGLKSVGYNVTVSRDMKCVHITPTFFGKVNDKEKAWFDEFFRALRHNKLFTKTTFTVKDIDGKDITLKGVFVLTDGGYSRWEALQQPIKSFVDEANVFLNELIESVRKDVERFFGALPLLRSLLSLHWIRLCCLSHW